MKVAIIHPWLPQYRVDFFKQLISLGLDSNIEFSIFYGETPPEWKERRDTGLPEGFTKLQTNFLRFGRRSINRKSIRPVIAAGPFDLIIVEQAVRNIETYELLLRKAPVAFWGHGRTYTQRIFAQQDKFKQWLTTRGRWFFAYTEGGAKAMISAGMSPGRVTVVQNSIDTQRLRDQIGSVTAARLAPFEEQHDLRGRTALFIGGLDASKRLPFLVDAAKLASKLDPDFRLLIAGTGDERSYVEDAIMECPSIRYLGPVFGEDKAVAIAASQVMAMPGRVGLVAVDSFAGLTPIITTDWEWHSVEFEYLESGTNAVITDDSEFAYAHGLIDTLQNENLLNAMRSSCEQARDRFTLDSMVENFMNGVSMALEEDLR